jgi:hypothetical protein
VQVVSTWLRKGRTPNDHNYRWEKSLGDVKLKVLGQRTTLVDSSSSESTDEADIPGRDNKAFARKAASSQKPQGVPQSVSNESGALIAGRLPINEIIHFHNAIRRELEGFVEEARSLRVTGTLNAVSLTSLVERYR